MGVTSDNIYLMAENNMENISFQVLDLKPDILVIDSIQTMYCSEITSAPGSVSQVREATQVLMKIAKQDSVATFFGRACYKTGFYSGPKGP